MRLKEEQNSSQTQLNLLDQTKKGHNYMDMRATCSRIASSDPPALSFRLHNLHHVKLQTHCSLIQQYEDFSKPSFLLCTRKNTSDFILGIYTHAHCDFYTANPCLTGFIAALSGYGQPAKPVPLQKMFPRT